MAMHMINRRIAGGEIPSSLPTLRTGHVEHQQPQQTGKQPAVDLLGLSSDFDETFSPATFQPTPKPQPQHHQQITELSRTQSVLQSNLSSETTRSQQAHSQLEAETRAIEELQKQIQQQKDELEKMKHLADEAEKQLEAEKKKKEKLKEELQMYRHETKHFKSRAENAQEELKQVKREIDELEKEKSAVSSPRLPNSMSSPSISRPEDVFALSSTGGLFAKVHDDRSSVSASSPKSTHSMPTASTQKAFDPFAGFKASQSTSQSTTGTPVTLNKLKEESELKRSTSATVDISEIESKFPDLSTMEQSFAAVSSQAPTSPSTASQSIPPPPKEEETIASIKSESALENKPKKESKYNFDLSVFEPPSTASNSNLFGGMSVKDELSSIFGSPTISNSTPAPTASTSTALDDIFGSAPSATAKDNSKQPAPSSFEDIFFNNK
ncbi:hypothetical protein RMATCC62417_15236 [Rhizopus microsporus]|nr:hypothetical protein RMATCC62417_15236 [Rhizopus microsporus]